MNYKTIFIIPILLFTSFAAFANDFGAVRGIVHDPQHRPVQNAMMMLKAKSSDWVKSVTTDASGEFQINAVPIGIYSVSAASQGFAQSSQDLTVISGTVPVVHFQLRLASAKEQVTVSGVAEIAPTDSATPITLVSRLDIERTPGADRTNSMAMITDYVPGSYVTHDQLHIRGGHQTTWLVDGVPVPNTNIASNIGPQFDPKDIDYLEVNRGTCITFAGTRVDQSVAIEVLEALRPLGVQAALDALDHSQNQTDEKRTSLELALQKARYEASRIERQYQATEPENRLVATELENRWNNALTHVAEVERRVEEASTLAPQLTAEQRQHLLALGDDLEQLWDHPHSPATLKKRILRTVLQEVIADTTDDPPSVHLKLHWADGSHTELTVRKNKTGYHNHINSEEVRELIRELALVCEDPSIVSILNRLGYRTGNGNTWTEKRVQHVRHTNGFPARPLPVQRLWITMQQAAAALDVSEMVVRRLIAQKILPAKQIVKFAPWMIERVHLELPAVRKEIRRVHVGRRFGGAANKDQTGLFSDSHEAKP